MATLARQVVLVVLGHMGHCGTRALVPGSQGVGLVRSGWWSRRWYRWDELGLGAREALARRARNKIPERGTKGESNFANCTSKLSGFGTGFRRSRVHVFWHLCHLTSGTPLVRARSRH